jgi:hypothetical protein
MSTRDRGSVDGSVVPLETAESRAWTPLLAPRVQLGNVTPRAMMRQQA